jgi:hypothetical protein
VISFAEAFKREQLQFQEVIQLLFPQREVIFDAKKEVNLPSPSSGIIFVSWSYLVICSPTQQNCFWKWTYGFLI